MVQAGLLQYFHVVCLVTSECKITESSHMVNLSIWTLKCHCFDVIVSLHYALRTPCCILHRHTICRLYLTSKAATNKTGAEHRNCDNKRKNRRDNAAIENNRGLIKHITLKLACAQRIEHAFLTNTNSSNCSPHYAQTYVMQVNAKCNSTVTRLESTTGAWEPWSQRNEYSQFLATSRQNISMLSKMAPTSKNIAFSVYGYILPIFSSLYNALNHGQSASEEEGWDLSRGYDPKPAVGYHSQIHAILAHWTSQQLPCLCCITIQTESNTNYLQ